MSDLRSPPTPGAEAPVPAPTPESASIIEASLIEPGADASIRPFTFRASDDDLAELKRRIEATRWPERELVDDGTQGVQLALMQALAHYWATNYDWRRCEAQLNALPNFITDRWARHPLHPCPLEA